MRIISNKIPLALVFLFMTFLSCNRDVCKKSCSGCLELYQPFVSNIDCMHIYINEEDNVDIRIKVIEIIDQRVTGDNCDLSETGEAFVVFDFELNGTQINDTLEVPGCMTPVLSSPSSTILHSVDIGENYKFTLIKLYPLSRSLIDEPYPIQEGYDILGAVTIK